MFKIGFLLCVGWEAGKLISEITVSALRKAACEIVAHLSNKDESVLKYLNETYSLEERRRLKRKYNLNLDTSEPEPKEEIVNKIGF